MSSDKWEKFNLAEITEIIGGGTPKTGVKEYWNGSIPWISVVDFVGDKKYIFRTEKSITQLGLENSSTRILKKGQIVISARGTVGELAILGKDMAFNQSCYGLSSKAMTFNDFLYYLLKYNIEQIRRKTNGAVFDTITRETFDHIEINLPPLPTQRRIAEILSALDDKIKLNRQTNATLEAIAQAIFKEWFVDFNFPGATGELVESELGMIPEGWRVGKLGDFVNISSGKGLQKNEFVETGYPVLGANGLIGYTEKYLLNEEVILTGRVGTLGTFQLVNDQVWISDNVLILQPINKEYYYYSYFWVKTIDFRNLNRGSTQPLVTKTDLLDQKMLIPDSSTLSFFDRVCRPLFIHFENNERQSLTLTTIRDTLLPKLMHGDIEV